jgi:hypothetical protein
MVVEDALWSGVASLREHATLLRKMAQGGHPIRSEVLIRDAQLKEQHARELESLVKQFSQ